MLCRPDNGAVGTMRENPPCIRPDIILNVYRTVFLKPPSEGSIMRSQKLTVVCALLAGIVLAGVGCGKKEKAAESVAAELAQKLDLATAIAARPAPVVSVTASLDLEFNTDVVPQ